MKLRRSYMLVFVPSLFVAMSALAHDPSEHAAQAEKPDCTAMKGMNIAKMDEADPVVQAMMTKCKGEMEDMEDMDHLQHDGQHGDDMPEKSAEQMEKEAAAGHSDDH